MSNFALRFAGIANIPALISVINAAFEVEKVIIEGDRTNATELAELLEKGLILMAEDESVLAGSVYIELRGPAAYFGLLAVSPDKQGRGLGRLLVEAAENFAREKGCSQMTMRIVDQRKELPAFYEKLGYSVTSVEPFPEGFETLVPCKMINMAKDLM